MNDQTILVVEDDQDLREALCDTLLLNGYNIIEADCAEAGVAKIQNSEIQFVVSDVNMPGMDGHQFLDWIKANRPELPVLLITAFGTVNKAVDAMQQGAVDYLVKPFEPSVLIETLAKFIHAKTEDQNEPVAVDPSSQRVLELARKVACTDSTILISGESGTGKEVLARYLHDKSNRVTKPFVAINCAAIPENMLEATLFGHEKGSFTGAINSAPGKFEQAEGGTLLLDEISEMDLGLQAKLLRVLQEREVERIGGRKTIKLNVRVLATTNRNLLDEVRKGTFREDLYYRLSVFPLQWKPLRERRLDLVPLAERLIKKHCEKMGKSGIRLDDTAKTIITSHLWPGNVREMDNAIQRSLILQTGQFITAVDMGLVGEELIDFNPVSVQVSEENDVRSVTEYAPIENAQQAQSTIASINELGSDLKQRELELIVDAIRGSSGRKKLAAEKLGISPRTLRYKLAKFRDLGVDVERVLMAG